MIHLIWAMDQNRLIGANQALPWHIKDDLAFFKSVTHQKTVVMGMQTYLSMKQYFKDKPFPYEKTYVLTKKDIVLNDAEVIHDIEDFIINHHEPLYVLGGSQVYDMTLKHAHTLFITYVLSSHVGDTYFKPYTLDDFVCTWFETKPGIILSKYERKTL